MGSMAQNTDVKRSVELRNHEGTGFVAVVNLTEFEKKYGHRMPKSRKQIGQYAFVPLDAEIADETRGELPETRGHPVAYVGDDLGKHYWTSSDPDEVPADVHEALEDSEKVLVDGVTGGWSNWDGRPEWSETYVDYSDAVVVEE